MLPPPTLLCILSGFYRFHAYTSIQLDGTREIVRVNYFAPRIKISDPVQTQTGTSWSRIQQVNHSKGIIKGSIGTWAKVLYLFWKPLGVPPPPYPAPGCDANPLQVTPSILMHIHHSFTLLGRERHCENKVYCQTTQCNKPAMMQTQTSSPTVQWTECKGGKKVLKGHSISHIGYCVYLKSVLSVLLK